MTVGLAHRVALLAVCALPVLGLLSGSALLWSSAVALLAVLVLAWPSLHEPTRSRARSTSVHALTLLGLAFALSRFASAPVDAGLIVVMLGLANRYTLRAGQRDDFIVVGSASALLAAATVVTPGIAFALIVLGFVPAALWAMLTASILSLSERAGDPSARHGAFRRLAARPIPALRGAVTGWGLVFMLIGYVAVSFLPRFRFGHLLSPGGLVAFSGAGAHMTLSTGGVSSSGGGVVLRVEPRPGMSSADLTGLYARLYALDAFDGRGFSDAGGAPRVIRELPDQDTDARCLSVTLQRVARRDQPHPVAVLGRRGPTVVLVHRPMAHPSGTLLMGLGPSALDARYRACLHRESDLDRPREGEAPGFVERFTALPPDLDPRIPELARRLTAEAGSPAERVRQILAHFGSGFRYSLDPVRGEAEDPLARFLFEAREGHCELYAGAAAALLRAAGVPARVASGYYGGWFNQRNRTLELSSEDAHAWVEAFIDGRWVWVDATPESGRARRTHKRFAWVRDVWDALEALWFEHVVDFDEERRRAVAARLEAGVGASARWLEGLGASLGGAASSGSGPRWAWFGVSLAVAAGLALLLRRRSGLSELGLRIRRRLRRSEDPSLPLGALLAHQPEPWRDVARRAVELYEARRFGPPADAPRLAEVRSAVRALERAAKRR